MNPYLPRSPRETLGGYVLLPRLIDKVRLQTQGLLPREYGENLLQPGRTTDGLFLAFTGIDGEELRNAISNSDSDAAVLSWVMRHALPKSDSDKQQWAMEIDAFRPDAQLTQRRITLYSDLAKKVDVSKLSVFDLIDMDEGRKPIT